MAVPTYWTAEMVLALPPDGQRHEVVHGEHLVTPAPTDGHQVLVLRLAVLLHQFCEAHGIGQVYFAPADLVRGEHTLVQPDLFVVPRAEAAVPGWGAKQTLLLVIEVLSPSSRRADRFTKRRLYQELGVPSYWIVDAAAAAVEVWAPEATVPVVERERVTWAVPGGGAACTIELRELFAPPG